jgi:hypothetical protein
MTVRQGLLRRNPETARILEEALPFLANAKGWTGLKVTFGHDEPAYVEIGYILSAEEARGIAAALTDVVEGGGNDPI